MRKPATALLAVPGLALAGTLGYPLLLVLGTARHGMAVLGSAAFLAALEHTVGIALAATAGSMALALVFALVLAFAPFRASRTLGRFADTMIALPSFLTVLALTFAYGSAGVVNGALAAWFGHGGPRLDFLYSAWGVILAEITIYMPFVMRPLLAAFEAIDRAQIEIATGLGGGAWVILRRVVLPAAVPALLAGGSLCLLLTLNEFGVVLFIGAKGVITLPLLVYDKAIQEFDYPAACAMAAVNIALALALFAAYRALLTRLMPDAVH
ncbi:MAG: 2-aminoethylphosphonate ABC transporter permease subunit [Rhodospirillales bacterium]|nr:2-aminoethylphosphonate ABC transporter permease subunit [Rhodospirillales bacterium]